MLTPIACADAARWGAALHANGVVRVSGVAQDRDHGALLRIGGALGRASTRALPRGIGRVEAGAVVRVESLASTPLDQFGKPLRSASAQHFALHTDESFHSLPARWVLLHCWRADPSGGGLSLLCRRERMLAELDAKALLALRQIRLPYPTGDYPILDTHGRLRFNRAECEGELRARKRDPTPADNHWLAHFEGSFASLAESCSLTAGELLIIDNHRTLHGRTAFEACSPRLLMRLRVL